MTPLTQLKSRNNVHAIGNAILRLLLSLSIVCGTCPIALSQRKAAPSPIEDNIPQALAERPDVKDLTRRLTLMRRNFSKMGENHPLYEKTRNDIRGAEQRLLQLLQNADSMPKERNDDLVEASPRLPRKKALGLESRPPWTPLPIPELRAQTPFALQPMMVWSDRGTVEILGPIGDEELLAIVLDDASPICRLVILRIHGDTVSSRDLGRATYAKAAVADLDFARTQTVYVAFENPDSQDTSRTIEVRELQLRGDGNNPISSQRTIGRLKHRGRLRLTCVSPGNVLLESEEIILQSSHEVYRWTGTTQRSSILTKSDRMAGPSVPNMLLDRQDDSKIPLLYEPATDVTWIVRTDGNNLFFSRLDTTKVESEVISLDLGIPLTVQDIVLESGSLAARQASFKLMERQRGLIYRLNLSDSITQIEAICDTTVSLSRFVPGINHQTWVRDDRGLLYRFVRPREQAVVYPPEHLSGLGIYQNMQEDRLNAAFIPYSLSAPHPVEHVMENTGQSKFWIGIPDGRIDYWGKEIGIYPSGTIFLQTLYSKAQPGKRMVTRLLIYQRREWFTYSYRWNESQSDAVLIEPDDPIPSYDRHDCKKCHLQPANDFILGFKPSKLAEYHEYSRGELGLQMRTLQHLRMIP